MLIFRPVYFARPRVQYAVLLGQIVQSSGTYCNFINRDRAIGADLLWSKFIVSIVA